MTHLENTGKYSIRVHLYNLVDYELDRSRFVQKVTTYTLPFIESIQ
jgi:hypothetical protein